MAERGSLAAVSGLFCFLLASSSHKARQGILFFLFLFWGAPSWHLCAACQALLGGPAFGYGIGIRKHHF